MKNKEVVKFVLKLIPVVILLGVTSSLLLGNAHSISGGSSSYTDECVFSEFNSFSNLSNGYARFFDKCYVPMYDFYETKKECSIFGFSCYESDNSHVEMIRGEVCFRLSDGERC